MTPKQEPIWGKGDKLTLEVLSKLRLKGCWLDLAAGDGRYMPELLNKVDNLVAGDINRDLLKGLLQNTPKGKRFKLKIKVFDLTKKLPFKDKSFDGVFCTGTLHLFSKKVLRSVFAEIDRVLRLKGKIIIDFATDIKRRFPSGRRKIFKDEPQYELETAKQFLKNLLKGYSIKIYESSFIDDLTKIRGYGYIAMGKFILLIANKK